MNQMLKGTDMGKLVEKMVALGPTYPRDLLRRGIALCFMEEDVLYKAPRSILGEVHMGHVDFDARRRET